MTWQGYAIVFGPLVLVATAFVSSFFVGGDWGLLLRLLASLGFIAWVVVAFYILSAMNTDI